MDQDKHTQSQSNPLRNSQTKQAAPQRQHFTLGVCLTERMNLIERLLSETVRASKASICECTSVTNGLLDDSIANNLQSGYYEAYKSVVT